ncbi:MAG: IS630 family transposase [Gemmatimonadaceae bacterium]|nr:IS630 family transposase [Gemmatimonadaceae bacterium]
MHTTPAKSTHWSTRLMAEVTGHNHSTIARIWRAHELKPHRIKTFKLSTDPALVATLRDVVGLSLHPPERAVVFAFVEKHQIPALDRTPPGLPMKKGRVGTMTHDDKSHGTTTLFAARYVATGTVRQDGKPRHRQQEVLTFLRQMEQRVPSDLEMHVILDNPATHKHPTVKRWLERHLRVHFHFTPTSASWLNLVERFFREITGRHIRRLAVTSVDQLIAAITQYIDRRNRDPTPFVWTPTVRQILKKVNNANETLATLR